MIKNTYSLETLSKTSKIALTGLSCIFLVTGCGNSISNYSGVEPQNRNEVEMVRIPYSVNFEDGATKLSNVEIARLNNFLATSNITYGNEFSMDFPLDRNGNISDIDSQRLTYMSDLLKDSGLYMSSTITPYGMEPRENTGRLIVSKYVVTLPECGWSQASYPNYDNAPTSNFGCASQANLGLMIANPKDLLTGQSDGKTNAERAAFAVERYQNTVTTVAPATAGTGN